MGTLPPSPEKTTKTQGNEKHINIKKFAGLSRDWAGGKILLMCFFRVIPYGGEKTHINKIPPKSRDNPMKMLFTFFFFLCVFFITNKMSLPKIQKKKRITDSYGRDRAPFWPFLGEGFWGKCPAAPSSPGPFVSLLVSLAEQFYRNSIPPVS